MRYRKTKLVALASIFCALGMVRERSLYTPSTDDFKAALANEGYQKIDVSKRDRSIDCPWTATFGRRFTAQDKNGQPVAGDVCRTLSASYISKLN